MIIQKKNVQNCPVCSSPGCDYLDNLKDVLYNVPDLWSMRKCVRDNCGTLWLDPVTVDSDLHKLYNLYSTHNIYIPPTKQGGVLQKKETNFLRTFLNKIRSAILHRYYGYPTSLSKCKCFIYSIISYLIPAWRDAQFANIFYIPYIENGKLLDVGCGNGSSMLSMKSKGWEVEGIDFDPVAISKAREQGLTASVADLYTKAYENEFFDVIMMNHVIEHVPNPEKILKECLRILKKGGILVAFTPNARSFGLSLFKNNWRGLETPRHLQVFTGNSLVLLAKKVGFSNARSLATIQGGTYILNASREIFKHGSCDIYTYGKLHKLLIFLLWQILGWVYILFPNKTEVVVLCCDKK